MIANFRKSEEPPPFPANSSLRSAINSHLSATLHIERDQGESVISMSITKLKNGKETDEQKISIRENGVIRTALQRARQRNVQSAFFVSGRSGVRFRGGHRRRHRNIAMESQPKSQKLPFYRHLVYYMKSLDTDTSSLDEALASTEVGELTSVKAQLTAFDWHAWPDQNSLAHFISQGDHTVTNPLLCTVAERCKLKV